jgi:hypothetical protein
MSNIQTGSIVAIAPCVQVRREGVRQHSRRLAPLSRAPDAAMTLPVRKLPDLIIKTCAMPLRAAWLSRMPCHGRLLLLCDLHRSWAPVAAHVHVLCTYSNDRYQCRTFVALIAVGSTALHLAVHQPTLVPTPRHRSQLRRKRPLLAS